MSDDDEDMGGADEGDTTSDDEGDGPIERFPPTELKPLLRLEVDGAIEMANRPYARGPHKCPICPMRQFRERRHFKHHIGKVHDNDESSGPPSSRVLQLVIALFNRDQLLSGTGALVGVDFKRAR